MVRTTHELCGQRLRSFDRDSVSQSDRKGEAFLTVQKIVRKCFRLFPKAVGVDSISILVIPGFTLIDSVTQVALRRRSTRLSRRAT